jgi:beta-galactosidase/beta-glucuronidase
MDLGGPWRLAPGDDELRRAFADDGFDDSGWAEAHVPGHWRRAPGLETSDGPVLHRKRFEAAAPEQPGRRSFVVFDGMFYQGDVWLDGLYLGDTEGYFLPHAFEVTDALAARSDHVLAVELTCAPQRAKKLKRNITGIFQDGGLIDPAGNPGGIWRPVRIVETGPVRITALRVRCSDAKAERARLEVTATLDTADAGEVTIRSTVETTDHERTDQLSAGTNVVSWRLDVAPPPRGWAWAHGGQPLGDGDVGG